MGLEVPDIQFKRVVKYYDTHQCDYIWLKHISGLYHWAHHEKTCEIKGTIIVGLVFFSPYLGNAHCDKTPTRSIQRWKFCLASWMLSLGYMINILVVKISLWRVDWMMRIVNFPHCRSSNLLFRDIHYDFVDESSWKCVIGVIIN